MHKKTAIQKPILDKIKIFLCEINLFIKEKTSPPAVLPIKANEPRRPTSIFLHSIPYSLTQL